MTLRIVVIALLLGALLTIATALAQDDDPPADTEPVTDVVVAETDEIGDDPELTAETPVAVDHDSIGVDVESAEDLDGSARERLADKSPFEMWEYLAGIIVSGLVIPIGIRRGWGQEEMKLLALVTAAIVAVGGAYWRGELDNAAYTGAGIMKLGILVWGAYETVWKVKFLSAVPRWIEAKTGGRPMAEAR